MESGRLIIFAKAPVMGTVKSRIATVVGEKAACAIYKVILATVFDNLRELADVEVRITPDSPTGFEGCPNAGWELKPQGDGDLGQRLQRAFAEAFEQNVESVLIIGSDCPEVIAADVSTAFHALQACDLVLGPAVDGGYWLIGLRRSRSELFEGIQWSSDRVLRQTIELANAANLRIHLLRQLNDIDTVEDWDRYRALP